MSAATPGQAGSGIEVTHDPEIPVRLVQLRLCDLCLDGAGGECHTPGCSLWINRAPDLSLRNNPMVTILAAQDDTATPGQAEADREVLRSAFAGFLASQGYDDQGRFDQDEMELAFETGWQIARAAPAAQPADAAISAWIENYPREFATWLATQRHVGGVTPESVAIAAQDAWPAPELGLPYSRCPRWSHPADDFHGQCVTYAGHGGEHENEHGIRWAGPRWPSPEEMAAPVSARARPAPELAGCGCPKTDGKIYHQRGTCTDPVAAKLDWYADAGRIAAAPAPELAAAMAALTKVAESHERVIYAALIDIRRGDPGAARRLLGEHLGVWNGLPWDGTETGAQYLERGRDGE